MPTRKWLLVFVTALSLGALVPLTLAQTGGPSSTPEITPGSNQRGEHLSGDDAARRMPHTTAASGAAIPMFRVGPDGTPTMPNLQALLSGPGASAAGETLWLHPEVRGTCSWIHAKHEHQAFITRGSPDGPRMAIDRIDLISEIGGDRQVKTCNGSEWCARTEHEYNLGCRRSCVTARATHSGYGTWMSGQSCIW
jgi:hypothetical protein